MGPSVGRLLRGLFSGGQTVEDLRLDDDPPDVDDLGDGVEATHLVGDVHLFPRLWRIDGYTKVARRLQQRLRLQPGETYFELPYDWRRDNRVAARKLERQTADWLRQRRQTYPDAKASLRRALDGRSDLPLLHRGPRRCKDTRALVTFGTPFRGSLNALDSLVNGVEKLHLLDLTELTRSFTSIYQLLPIYPCYDDGGTELIRLRDAAELPTIDIARVRAADKFHREIEHAVRANQDAAGAGVVRYAIKPVVGIEQPTGQSARLAGNRVEILRSRDGTDDSATAPFRVYPLRRSRRARNRPPSPPHATPLCRTPTPCSPTCTVS